MSGGSPRRGGWPGPRKPQWSFRPTPVAEKAVTDYVTESGMDSDRDRSRAINALLVRATSSLDDILGAMTADELAALADRTALMAEAAPSAREMRHGDDTEHR